MDKVIFWDFDGTIVHQNESFRDSLVKAFADHGYEITANEAKEHLKRICSWYLPDQSFVSRTGRLWWEDLLQKLEPLLDNKKIPGSTGKKILADFKYNAIHFPYTIYDGAADILSYCKKQGYSNYILSSNFPELDRVIAGLGLSEYFNGFFLTSAIGYEKPVKELYLYAYERAGKPSESFMVGDNPVADMKGAKSVGMRTILVHKNGAKYPAADFSVKVLDEIRCFL